MRTPRLATFAAALSLAAALAGAAAGAGPPIPPAPTRFVTDKANVLSRETVDRLERSLRDFEAATSNQLLVYTESVVPDGTTIEEYTVACAEAWKAGQKEEKNGLVLFVFPGSKAARFEVGYGLEGALPDALAGRILNEEIVPRMAKGDFDGGVRAGVAAAMAATKGEYKGKGRSTRRERSFPWGFLIVFIVLPILLGGRRRRYSYIGGGGFGTGGFGGWGGGFGGGGGFSGGGGSFGGGGATGRW